MFLQDFGLFYKPVKAIAETGKAIVTVYIFDGR